MNLFLAQTLRSPCCMTKSLVKLLSLSNKIMDSITDSELYSRYAYTPERIRIGMVRVDDASAIPAYHPQREWPSTKGLGYLDKLPFELLDMVIDQVDILSLIQVGYTCRRGQELVASIPSYAKLLKHCPHTLAALSKMRLLELYTCKRVEKALQSEECCCCGNFGAFLFLLSCERCCFQCLKDKPALWVIPRAQAGKFFHLSTQQMKTMPTARSVPGKYFVTLLISRPRTQLLVGVRAVKELAIRIHGSDMTDCLRSLRALSEKEYGSFMFLRRAQLNFSRHDPRMISREANAVNDMCNGMGTIRFPHLPPLDQDQADMGSWCRGCKWVWQQADQGKLPADQVSRIVPGNRNPSTFCYDVAFREWRRAEFLLHARTCYGIQQMERRVRAGIWSEFDNCL